MSERFIPRDFIKALIPDTDPDVGGSTSNLAKVDYDGVHVLRTTATKPQVVDCRELLPSWPTIQDADIN